MPEVRLFEKVCRLQKLLVGLACGRMSQTFFCMFLVVLGAWDLLKDRPLSPIRRRDECAITEAGLSPPSFL